MTRIIVEPDIIPGSRPNYRFVRVKDTNGQTHEVHLDEVHLLYRNGLPTVHVGSPVARDQSRGRVLVELPEQTAQGFWRVWVHESDLIRET